MLEESGIVFKVLLVAPMPTKKFDSGAVKWATHLRASGPNKIRAGADKPIEKLKAIIKEKARSESITEDEVLKKYPALFKMLKGYQLSKEKTEKALLENPAGFSRFELGVDKGMLKYDRKSREYFYPLYGSKKKKVKGLIFLGLMALTGDRRLVKCLKPGTDKISAGNPLVICPAERQKDFGIALRARLSESGAIIIKDNLSMDVIKNQNRNLNRLVNLFRLPELAEFEPGGASHIDFIVVEISDTPGRKLLALDIKVSKKD